MTDSAQNGGESLLNHLHGLLITRTLIMCRAVFGLDANVFADDLHLPLLGRDFRLVSVL